jgi:plastocyanin
MKKLSWILIGVILFVGSLWLSGAAVPEGTKIASDAGPGTIEGVVIYESDRKRPWRYRRHYVRKRTAGHLAEAVVSLADIKNTPAKKRAGAKKAVLDQKDYNFVPETQALRAGTAITFTNSDPFQHDITAKSSRQRFSVDLRQFDKIPRVLDQPGGIDDPLALTCAYHSAMRGWIFVFDHDYFVVTGEDGKFRVEDVPAGKHKLIAVHAAGQLRSEQEVVVPAGRTVRVEIRLSPDNLIEKKKQQPQKTETKQ